MHPRRVNHKVFFLVGISIPIAVLGIALVAGSSKPSQPVVLGVDRAIPIPGGYRIDLNNASAAVGFPVPIPNTPNASTSSVKAVWVSTKPSPQALVDFSSGVREIIYPNEISDSFERWSRKQIAEGIPGRIIQLDSVTAFSVPQDSEDPGSVSFVCQGLFFQVIGHGDFTSKELEDAAASIIDQLTATV